MHRVDQQVDDHLLQLVTVDGRPARRVQLAPQHDVRAHQQVRHQHQAALQHRRELDLVDVAGELVGARELQQLGHDEPHALDLLVDQPQFAGHALRIGAEQLARQVEVALDHGDRVVHLVRDAGGELAHRGELLAAHQLLLRGLQRARALGHLGVELGVPAL